MKADELISRVKRIYASIQASQEFNMTKLRGKVFRSDRVFGVFQDFSGGQGEEEMSNTAHLTIHNIANLRDNLRRWAARTSRDKSRVDQMFNASQTLKIIQDLSNNDKHGYPPRDSGFSRLAPRLEYIRRNLQLTTKAKAGSWVAMTMDSMSVPQIAGDGSACAIVTADVMDKDGKLIGDLAKIELAGIEAWEMLLAEYGISVPK